MWFATSSPFPPAVKQKGNSFEQIFKAISKHKVYPPFFVAALEADVECQCLIRRLKELTKDGSQCMISTSLPAMCNLMSCRPPPPTVVCDVFLVTPNQPPMVFTFTRDPQDQDVCAYNKSVAKALTYARYFTKEGFDILYGVVTEEDVKSAEAFRSRMSEVRESTSTYCIPSNLVMSHHRCTEIYRAVIMCSALTQHTETKMDDGASDCHYVLSLETYTKLMTDLNSPSRKKHRAVTDDEKYFITILEERLSRLGHMTDVTQSSKMATAEPINQGVLWKSTELFAKHDSDSHQTDLCDLVALPHGGESFTILVADQGNECIKRVTWSPNGQPEEIESLHVGGKPGGLTKISSNEVLVPCRT